ncbi:MAG: hypothetical protein JXR63_04715 [Spirochaetales bacterium]|nr:hypothetical protein [Spirochaetales bacterium]
MEINFSNSQFKAASNRLDSTSSGFLFIKVKEKISPFFYKVQFDSQILEIRSTVELVPGELLKVKLFGSGNKTGLKILQRFGSSNEILVNSHLLRSVLDHYKVKKKFSLADKYSDSQLVKKAALSVLLDQDLFTTENETIDLFCNFVEEREKQSKKRNFFNSNKRQREKYQEAADYISENNKDNWLIKYFLIEKDSHSIDGFIYYRKYGDKITNINLEACGEEYYYFSYNLDEQRCYMNFDPATKDSQVIFDMLKKNLAQSGVPVIMANKSIIFDGFYAYPEKRNLIDCVV